jgi:CheY-like chemotaxis protein
MSKRILLIDSDESFAQTLQQAIAARGLGATVASNSEQGMQLARTDAPDLIVVCVEAQPTNGYMLCTRLKKDDALKGIPVILTSANATADSFEKHKKLKTRAEEYLIKPFHPAELLEKAAALLNIELPPEAAPQQEEEIVSMEDEPIGLGDLVGEDEPVHLSDSEAAEAHAGGAPAAAPLEEEVVEVEEVQQIEEQPETSHEDELQMFDAAFDALAPAKSQADHAAEDKAAFAGLRLAPAPEVDAAASAPEAEPVQEQEIAAEAEPALESIPLESLPLDAVSEQAAPGMSGVDPDLHAAVEARVQELEAELAAKDSELEAAKKAAHPSGGASTPELIKLKEARTRGDKEILRLKQELNEKEKNLNEKESELIELREEQTTLESQAQTLKDEGTKREAAAKALQQRAEALAAAAKKFERELGNAREELKTVPGLKSRIAELEGVDKAHQELQRRHADLAVQADQHRSRGAELEGEVEKHKTRASELDTELSGARALHESEVEQLRDELKTLKDDTEKLEQQLEGARGEAVKALSDLAASREETEHARTDVSALTGEKDLLSEERDDLRRQLEEAQASAAQNEERAVKAYQRIKGDEKLREKTRKALQIALQLLDEVPQPVEGLAETELGEAEQQSA